MSQEFSRRFFLGQILFLIINGCTSKQSVDGALTIGVINYDGGEKIIDQYAQFKRYLGETTKAKIILEPAFNENKAIERLESRAWSLIFAPPGIAAIAIARHQYIPIFPLVGVNNLRCVFVTREESPIRELKNLQDKTVALGQLGSATGYYFPLYNLYGLTLAEVLSAPTPKIAMEWVAEGKAVAAAVSMTELNLHLPAFKETRFRILYTDPHYVPPGVVLIEPSIERKRQDYIRASMSNLPANLAEQAGYIPNAPIPNYKYMISVVERVQLISSQLQSKPVQLFNKTN